MGTADNRQLNPRPPTVPTTHHPPDPTRQTSLQNTFTCQPQQRNPHGRVFGGFLLRRAFELAFATCYLFAGTRPVFDCVDDVQVGWLI